MNTYGLFDMMGGVEPRLLGPGTGWEAGGIELERRKARDMALQEMLLNNQQKQAEYGRYTQSTPHEVEKLNLGNQKTRAEIPGVQAQSEITGLNRDLQRATQPGVIGATNAQNQVSTFENALRQIELAAETSPMYADADYQRLRMNAPEEIQRLLPQHWEPGLADKARNIVMNNPAHRRAEALKNIEGLWGLDHIKERNQGAAEAARIAAEGRKSSATIKAAQEKIEAKLAQLIQKQLDGKGLNETEQKLYEDLQTMLFRLKAATGYGMYDQGAITNRLMFGDPNQPQGPVPPRGAPPPVPSPQQGPNGITAPLGTPQNPIPLR